MDEPTIHMVLERLGCRKIRTRGDEVWATCPNESNHYNGTDNNPSFSARIEPDGKSPCSCFACDLSDLLEHLATICGIPGFNDYVYAGIDKPDDWIHMPANNRGIFGFTEETGGPMFPPERALEIFERALHRTLSDRGFGVDVAKAWELLYDRVNGRAIFVVRDRMGRLRGVSGRAVRNGQRPKYLHYSWDTAESRFWPRKESGRESDFVPFEKSALLYGEHMVDWDRAGPTRQLLVVVEGQTDVLRSWQAKWNAVAPFGSSVSPTQISTIIGLVPRGGGVLIASDADAAGRSLERKIRQGIGDRVPLYGVDLPEGSDPADMDWMKLDEVYSSCKLVKLR